MAHIAFRETRVLLLALAVSLLASQAGDAGRLLGALAVAIYIPFSFFFFCITLEKLPSGNPSGVRRVAAQLSFLLALFGLLVFETGVAIFAGLPGIPVGSWFVVLAFGAGFVFLSVLAHSLACPASHQGF